MRLDVSLAMGTLCCSEALHCCRGGRTGLLGRGGPAAPGAVGTLSSVGLCVTL